MGIVTIIGIGAAAVVRLGLAVALAVATLATVVLPVAAQTPVNPTDPAWAAPDAGALPDDDAGRLIRRGRDLIAATYAHIGPDVTDRARRYAGNNLACQNCHLDAGRKKFALPLWAAKQEYPRYTARTGEPITLEQRVNECLTRSMNGRAMPVDAPDMQAFVAYIGFLAAGIPKAQQFSGLGAGQMHDLDRAADPARGRAVYARTCVPCHGSNGAGVPRTRGVLMLGYMVPPLWGPDSFNDGAGMARLSTAANFIHFNMPHGTSFEKPWLSEADAWDVAAYVISQKRPQKSGLAADFPDRLEKPVDTPYGPYADGFSEEQHKYGPFGPIRDAVARLKARQDGGKK
jgi:thiosulfate dehydrogenase